MAKINFKDIVEPDPNNLHYEWIEQPNNYLNASDQEAEAEKERDYAKIDLDVIKAQWKEKLDTAEADLYSKVRKRPAFYGLPEKPTDKAISSVLMLDENYRELRKESREAIKAAQLNVVKLNYQYNLIKGGTKAIGDQKKSSLEHLVRLFEKGYYSTPLERRSRGEKKFEEEAYGERIKSQSSDLKERLLRRRNQRRNQEE